ncbi:hypothetical protein WN944_007333 [Citrus x changshan-huyou]|uniref:F-box domain-containing protein n=1 Tax=Citrus x changshan-huyou TaxID=2935761 RepID=A0AAP0MKS6_9ROSI
MAVGGGAESKRMKIERQWSSSWSRLPEDIIFSIMNRLGYVGQLRFRAVCKSWRQANIRGIKSADTLPWKMAVDPRSCCFVTLLTIKNTLLIQRPGETTWIKLAIFKFFDTEDSSEKYGPAHNVEYVDGVLFISFEQIAVVAYNPKLDDSKLYPYPCNEGKNIVYEYLFESDGNLLLYHDELDDLVFRDKKARQRYERKHKAETKRLGRDFVNSDVFESTANVTSLFSGASWISRKFITTVLAMYLNCVLSRVIFAFLK